LKECFYKQYAVPRVRGRHVYLTQPPHQQKYQGYARPRLRSQYVIGGTLAQVRS